MATREENLKKINEEITKLSNDELEKLSDDELDEVAGGCRYPGGAGQRGIDAYRAIKNLIELIKGGNKVY